MRSRLILPMLLLVLAGCGDRSGEPAPPAAATVDAPADASPPVVAPTGTEATVVPTVAPDLADAAGTRVTVALSPAAAARLEADAETIIVSATWFGEPQDTPEALAVSGGEPWLTMAQMDQELPGPGDAVFPDMPLDPTKLALIATPPQFHVNVFSGRRSSENNLLSCGMYQDDLAKAAAGIAIDCKLIDEDAP